jgi:hypothetical protein
MILYVNKRQKTFLVVPVILDRVVPYQEVET